MALYQGPTTKAYISSINFLDQRDILNEVFDVTAEDSTILDIMELTGKMVVTDVPTFSAFTDDYLFQAATITSVAGSPNDGSVAGGVCRITFSAQDNLPVVGELAMLQSKNIGRVQVVNTGTNVVDIYPLNPADTLGVPSASQVVIFWSDAQGEGDPDPVGRRPRFSRTENSIQIFKTANQITDLQKVSTVEVQYAGKNYIMYKLQHDTLRHHRMKIAHAMLVGKKGVSTDTVTGSTVYTTQGLRNYILNGDGTVYTTGGVSVSLASAAITQAKLRSMMRSLDKRQAPKEYMYWVGGTQRADFHELIQNLNGLTAGGVTYNAFGSGDAKQRAIDLGVDTLRMYNRTLHVKTIDAYDHPNNFGNANFNFDGEAYLIPSGKLKTDEGGKTWDYLTVRYMSGDGTDLKYLEAVTGKLAPNGATDGTAVLRFSYQSVMGLQAIGTRLFGIFTP